MKRLKEAFGFLGLALIFVGTTVDFKNWTEQAVVAVPLGLGALPLVFIVFLGLLVFLRD